MTNLIPKEAQTRLRSEYRFRVATVWMMLAGSAGLFCAVLLAPVYILIGNLTVVHTGMYEETVEQNNRFASIEAEIRENKNTAQLLLIDAATVPVSVYLQDVLARTGQGITLDMFSAKLETNVFQITGRSATRQDLAAFKERLEQSQLFATAELPISSLASERNINYTITLTPKGVSE